MVKRNNSDTFEIVVVLAIVAIVAFTGQVLIFFDQSNAPVQSVDSQDSGMLSGFAVAEDVSSDGRSYYDLSVEKVEVNPPTPLIGDPFRVTIYVKNNGNTAIATPFYVEAKFQPKGDYSELAPLVVSEVMPKILEPGDGASVSFLVTTIVPEGPLMIIATVDSTGKIDDDNTANNQLSKTLVIAVE